MLRQIVLAAAIAACMIAPANAQDEQEAIVVTGSRIAGLGYDSLTPPHITMRRRADSVVVDLVVRNDTRDAAQRLNEMREALRALQGRARAGGVTLALVIRPRALFGRSGSTSPKRRSGPISGRTRARSRFTCARRSPRTILSTPSTSA